MSDFRGLLACKEAFANTMAIFETTKDFPPVEMYALTKQMRNSGRSVCSNLAEGYRKRKYPDHFVAKATDADMENSETIVWLDFSLSCGYIYKEQYNDLISRFEETGRLIKSYNSESGEVH